MRLLIPVLALLAAACSPAAGTAAAEEGEQALAAEAVAGSPQADGAASPFATGAASPATDFAEGGDGTYEPEGSGDDMGGPVSPSFSCKAASAPIERRICANRNLIFLDRDMGNAYRQAREKVSGADRDELLAGQRRFLANRDRCGTDKCVADLYIARMNELIYFPVDVALRRQAATQADDGCGGPPQAYRELAFQCTRVGGSQAECDAARSCTALRVIIRRECARQGGGSSCAPIF